MGKIDKQQANVSALLDLIKENPTLRIMPMVDTEFGADDSYSWWMAKWGSASIEEVYFEDERVYIRSFDEDTLIENLLWDSDFTGGLSGAQAIKKAENKVSNYNWEKVIAVKIEI